MQARASSRRVSPFAPRPCSARRMCGKCVIEMGIVPGSNCSASRQKTFRASWPNSHLARIGRLVLPSATCRDSTASATRDAFPSLLVVPIDRRVESGKTSWSVSKYVRLRKHGSCKPQHSKIFGNRFPRTHLAIQNAIYPWEPKLMTQPAGSRAACFRCITTHFARSRVGCFDTKRILPTVMDDEHA